MSRRSQANCIIERNHFADMREMGIRFALWAAELRRPPSPERIRLHFGMSRASAYRWRKAWFDVMGLETRRPNKPPTIPRNRVMKLAAEHRRATKPAIACNQCAHFRGRLTTTWWGDCQRHSFPTRPCDTCLVFKPRESFPPAPTASGKALPAARTEP